MTPFVQSTPNTPDTHPIGGAVGTDAGEPVTPPPPGYDLFEEVGRGGMGVVFRGRDRNLNREVAVKVLHPRYAPGSAAATRFLDEARITAQLQHRGVPTVFRAGVLDDGRPFLAMRLIRGRTLDQFREGEAPAEPFVLATFERVCRAVGHAHRLGVIHRDLKPANVMLDASGEVLVIDWGLARVLRMDDCGSRNEDGESAFRSANPESEIENPQSTATVVQSLRGATLTQAGSVLGTPSYMPPEQASGAHEQIDRRSDVFGLGAILCALLTGRSPYPGDDAVTTRQLAARADLADCFARLDGCGADPDLVELCKRCLAKDPADRPADANAVAAAVADLRRAAAERARRAEVDRAVAAALAELAAVAA